MHRVEEGAPGGGAPGGGAPPLAPVAFSTDRIAPADRFEAWRAYFRGVNEMSVPPERRASFAASNRTWTLGGLVLTQNRTPGGMRLLRTPEHARRAGLDHWVLRVLGRGATRSRIGERAHETRARQVVMFSLAGGSDGVWDEADWVSLCVPRDAFPALSGGLSAVEPGPQSGTGAALLADYLLSLPGHLPRATEADVPAVVEATRSMIAACLLTGVESRGRAAAATPAPLLRERVRRAVLADVGSARLDPERLGRAAGVSRSTLYRVFEAEGGVARYVQRTRLSLAHAALRDPERATTGIAAVAEAHGLHNAAAFSRAFRREFGCSPGEVRAAALLGAPDPGGGGSRAGGGGRAFGSGGVGDGAGRGTPGVAPHGAAGLASWGGGYAELLRGTAATTRAAEVAA